MMADHPPPVKLPFVEGGSFPRNRGCSVTSSAGVPSHGRVEFYWSVIAGDSLGSGKAVIHDVANCCSGTLAQDAGDRSPRTGSSMENLLGICEERT